MAVVAVAGCRLFSASVACVDDAVCLAGERCLDGACTADPGGEGEGDAGEGDAGEGDAGEGDAGEGEGEPGEGDVGEGEGDEGEGEGDAGEGEGEGDGPCPLLDGVAGARANTGSCFHHLRAAESLTVDQAEATCASVGAQLAVPLDGDEIAVGSSVIPNGGRAFLGMRDFVPVGGTTASRFLPFSFELVDFDLVPFFNNGQPEDLPVDADGATIQEDCIDMGSGGNWNDIACTVRRGGALCEVPRCGNGKRDGADEECDGEPGCDACVATACPHPADTKVVLTVEQDGARCLVRLNDTYDVVGLKRAAAVTACTSRAGADARLVLPTSAVFNHVVRNLGRKLTRLDVSDVVTDGSFLTTDGVAPNPEFFSANQPADAPLAEDCAVARTTSPGSWLAEPCSRNRGVVCEVRLP